MKLILDSDPRIHLIRGYEPGAIQVGTRRLDKPFFVAATHLQPDWPVDALATLTEAGLAPLLQLRPQIVLLGGPGGDIGAVLPLRTVLGRRRVALEIMDVGAACRTYNILAQEARSVVAGLFP